MKRKSSFPFLFWRGNALWSRKQWPDKPKNFRYPMNLRTDGTVADMRRQEERAALELKYRPVDITSQKIFDIQEEKAPYRPTFNELADRFLDSIAPEISAEEARKDYRTWELRRRSTTKRYQVSPLRKEFGKLYWDEITRDSFEKWVDKLTLSGSKLASIKCYCQYAKRIFRHAMDETDPALRISSSPVERFKAPRGQNNVRDEYYPPEDFERNLKWIENRFPEFYPFYLAMVTTGRRPSEIARWTFPFSEDTLPDGKVVHYLTIEGSKAKNGRQDVVYFSDRLWKVVFGQGWRSGQIFRNPYSSLGCWRCTDWNHRISYLKKAFPNDDHLQRMWARDTRRGKATFLLEKQHADISVVQRILGHHDSKSTERYRTPQKENVLRTMFPESYNSTAEVQQLAGGL